MPGHFERYWEMTEGGPYSGQEGQDEAEECFKCKDCGAETFPDEGWNGEPDPEQCHEGCPSRASDWRPGRVSDAFRKGIEGIRFDSNGTGRFDIQKQHDVFKANFDLIFPDAPGVRV
ncbi:MAG: hypothetical protein JRC93_13385 [Deltaproteobacteria bacterium]|nr:hypothetical protein [Deltaproteobacteria bacterium]